MPQVKLESATPLSHYDSRAVPLSHCAPHKALWPNSVNELFAEFKHR